MSEILVDNLTGKTSAGDITVTSEGGAATQSLQQGLAKAWVRYDGTAPASGLDSLNISSITDAAVGDQKPAFTNNMANDVYSNTATSAQYHIIGLSNNGGSTGTPTTGFRMITYDSSHIAVDTGRVASQVTGDLA